MGRLLVAVGRMVRYRLLRFRMETFGLYYPSFPHAQPWWRVSPSAARLLLRRLGRYRRWLGEMEAVDRGGGPRWWAAHLDRPAHGRWVRALAALDRDPDKSGLRKG